MKPSKMLSGFPTSMSEFEDGFCLYFSPSRPVLPQLPRRQSCRRTLRHKRGESNIFLATHVAVLSCQPETSVVPGPQEAENNAI